ncbi:MAG: Na+/H+ antiporter NhaA [Ignavibacteriaceae bacterium]
MKKTDPIFPVSKIIKPFQEFVQTEASGGILLLICTICALLWANSPFSEAYFHLWHTKISIIINNTGLAYSLHHWINDGLMAIFFFVVGLEIKRELLVGELSSFKKASLPVAAALGGMLFPAGIYLLFNAGSKGASGWGIPMATDIAFVIGIMAILGSKVPVSLKVFVTALAIADDIGAVLVIAFFYTSEISLISLAFAGGIFILLLTANLLGVRNLLIYVVLGIGLWFAFLMSGIHATVAGVLLALTIPSSSRINTKEYIERNTALLRDFDNAGEEELDILKNEERQMYIHEIENNSEKILPPLQRFEHSLAPWVSFVIMPLFALANAGVAIGEGLIESLLSPISTGIVAGLFIGKQAGIFLFSWLSIKFGLSSKPEGVNWKSLYGGGILAGIGFTMSLFITNLAFTNNELIETSKVGILLASLISAIIGYYILNSGKNSDVTIKIKE